LEKIAALKAAGIDLYPNNIKPQNTTADIFAQFGETDSDTLSQMAQKVLLPDV